MKVTVTEIREAKFVEIPGVSRRCNISYKYIVRGDDIEARTFYSKDSAEEYVKYLQEIKNDYEKIIKEIEI